MFAFSFSILLLVIWYQVGWEHYTTSRWVMRMVLFNTIGPLLAISFWPLDDSNRHHPICRRSTLAWWRGGTDKNMVIKKALIKSNKAMLLSSGTHTWKPSWRNYSRFDIWKRNICVCLCFLYPMTLILQSTTCSRSLNSTLVEDIFLNLFFII